MLAAVGAHFTVYTEMLQEAGILSAAQAEQVSGLIEQRHRELVAQAERKNAEPTDPNSIRPTFYPAW